MSYYYRDKLSIKTNKMVASLLAEFILLSEKVESFRQILASVPFYDCVELFRVLDREQKGYLTLKDFIELIGQTHKKVVTYSFAWFDQAKIGQISRLEFISFLMPRRDDQLREIIARRIQEPVKDQNYSDTINQQLRIFTDMINQMISHELKVIQSRRQLIQQTDYSVKGVLNSLKSIQKNQFATTNDILRFLKNYAIQATKQQIEDLVEITDSKLQGKVTLQQLSWLLEGLQNKNKQYLKKVNSSLRKSKKHIQETLQNSSEKVFVRTPLRSKASNTSRDIHFSSQKSPNNTKTQKKSRQPKQSQSIKSSQKKKSTEDIKRQVQRQNQTYQKPDLIRQFDQILNKFKQAEIVQLQRDAQLLRSEEKIGRQLQDEYIQKTAQRKKRAYSQANYSNEQNKPINKHSYIQRSLQRENIFSNHQSQYRGSRLYTSYYAPPLTSAYDSIYDRKINTIIENFYLRNQDTAHLHSSSIKYENQLRLSLRQRQRPIGVSSYDRNPYTRTFLEDSVYNRQMGRTRPFNDENQVLKTQIQRKLGNNTNPVKLPIKYDQVQHRRVQNLIEGNLNRLKQKAPRVQISSIYESPDRLKNIRIQQKYTSNAQIPQNKPIQKSYRQENLYKTQVKNPSMPVHKNIQKNLLNTDASKNRGISTTQTKYPAYGSIIKSELKDSINK